MKPFVIILTLCAGITINAGAQTFTQRIQQQATGKGTITIHQDAAIDELVNESKNATTEKSTAKTNAPAANSVAANTNAGAAATDVAKKPALSGRKVNGYRVQVFAGGNTRKDRQTAEQIRNSLKSKFPGEAVYVHFYSPRWICRMGNYRTYEEADQMLQNVRRQGFNQASIVKGKINAPY